MIQIVRCGVGAGFVYLRIEQLVSGVGRDTDYESLTRRSKGLEELRNGPGIGVI